MAKAKRKDVLLLQQSIERTVRLLTGMDIPVYQRGSGAYVSWKDAENSVPEYVNIPVISDNASQKLIDAIQGFIDHEVAHILYTDASFVAKGWDVCQNEHQGTEDCYIEWRTVQDHPGANSNLHRTRVMMIKEIINPLWVEHGESSSVRERWGLLIICAFRAWSGQPEFVEYMEDKWDSIQPVVDSLEEFIPQFPPKSSEEAYELALGIHKALYGDASEEPKSGKGGDKEEDGDEDGSGSGDGSSDNNDSDKDDGDGDQESSGDSNDTKDSGEESGGKGDGESDGEGEDRDDADDSDSGRSDNGDSEGESDDADHEEKADDNGDSEDNSGRGGDSDEGMDTDDWSEKPDDSGEESDGHSGKAENTADCESDDHDGEAPESDVEGSFDTKKQDSREPLFEGEEPPEKNEDDHLAKLLESIAGEEHSSESYVPYTRIYDDVSRHTYDDGDTLRETMRKMQESVDQVSGGLRRHMTRMFQAMNRDRWESGKHSGKLDSANLQRLKTNDPRVFKVKHMTRTKKVAVSLVVDCSGSMSGDKIMSAMMTAWAFAETLSRMGINFEIIGFTTKWVYHTDEGYEDLREAQDKYGPRGTGEFVRYEPIRMPIFKDWNEKFDTDKKLRIADYPVSGHLSQNVDGESINYAGDRLLRQPEERKIMIVLSDGQPACGTVHDHVLRQHLKDSIDNLEKQGVNVIGVGIKDRSVKGYYRKNVVIDSLSDLPGAVIRELGKLVLAA